MRALADAVRRLVDATVRSAPPADETAALADEVNGLAQRLEAHVPDLPFARFVAAIAEDASISDRMPFDAVIGPFNPIALPVEVTVEGGRAVGRARFTTPYEGPPGLVHGGVIAAAFDMVLSVANHAAQAAGPTVSLTMRYRRPTLLDRDLVIEAEVAESPARSRRRTQPAAAGAVDYRRCVVSRPTRRW